ncbi:Transposase IS116/IS110/IS902 family protein [Cohnella sp. OV330]|uniref:IS110 family transposase n=1 Tax=Cohnella sp. OV330 TaxID=1855288 RepID=UPI0008F078E4|nr:IS110 family transposase [Cohnella sp. OV330]SFB63047.1 Transposase IS116/IS110/IS902 family protein [Cohnella sp. OV330]
MKFKAQAKQNQLLERISTQHLVVGIDIAQQSHVARAVNFRGILLGTPLHFSNDDAGFSLLLQWMKNLQETHQLNDAIIGMEPTGHYWLSLAAWLKSRSLEVVLVNPHLVKKNKENRDNTPSKSDIKDAFVIADMVKNGYYTLIKESSEVFMELRVLMANRETIVHRLVSAKNQIHRWVDIVFPELRQVYKHLIGAGALATLRLFPTPADLQKLTVRQVVEGWKTVMKRHSGERRAGELLALAACSVGAKHAEKAYKLHLQQLLAEYDLATEQLQVIEDEVANALARIPLAKPLLAIKGLSTLAVAGILGEAGDLSGYAHGNALLRHAGLNLAEASSGKWKGQMSISKRGRPRLRHALFMATMALIMNDESFKRQHEMNVKTKSMKPMRSVMKLCGRLARLLVAIAQSGEAYEPNRALPLKQTA